MPASVDPTMTSGLMGALRYSLGANAVIRESMDENLHHELLASAAIPIVFDPVVMPMADGSTALYADGGIASNITVSAARTVSRALDVVLVDRPIHSHRYENAIDIVLGSYDTMQRVIIENEMRHLYFESLGKRAALTLAPSITSKIERRAPALKTLIHDLPATDIAYKRPKDILPADFTDFDRQERLDATFKVGEADSGTPFTPYVWETFAV